MNSFNRCIELYETLLGEYSAVIDVVETRSNLSAAFTAAGRPGDCVKRMAPHSSDGSTFERVYNEACAFLDAGDLGSALSALDRAERLGRATLQEDGLTEEEMADELTVVTVQVRQTTDEWLFCITCGDK